MPRLLPLVVLPVALVACTGDSVRSERALAPEAARTTVVYDGTPEGVGVLAMLNDGSTTTTVLDIDAALDARAARSIVSYRNGSDGTFGTADDNTLDSIDEVDARTWVGDATLGLLVSFASAEGWVPEGEDPLGTYDSVAFTVEEAEWTVDFANDATLAVLDDDLGLDSRAAANIVAAQPLVSVKALADVKYVGKSAMAKLLAAAVADVEAEAAAAICTPTLAAASNGDATDFTTLLALSTTVDQPFAEVTAYTMSGCSSFYGEATDEATVLAALWDIGFSRSGSDWDGLPSGALTASAWATGGSTFSSRLDRALDRIDERVSEGDFDPASSAEATALYAARETLVDALEAGFTAAPSSFVEIDLDLDASECSESATVLIDTRDGSVLVVHEFANC